MFKVKLHSNAKEAANATDNTLKMMGGKLLRDGNDNVVFDKDENASVSGSNEDFLKFAIKQQGYVKEVIDNN